MKTQTAIIGAALLGIGAYVFLRGGIKGGGKVAGIVNGAARAVGVPAYSTSQTFYEISGNEGMSEAEQRAQYGAGRRVAEVYDSMGMSGPGAGIGMYGFSRDT